jgi:hypothetical protein
MSDICPTKGIRMKKLTRKVSFRVTEEMCGWIEEVGADMVRLAILEKMHPIVVVDAEKAIAEVVPEGPEGVATPEAETKEPTKDRFAEARAKVEAKLAAEAEAKKGLSPLQQAQLKYVKR